MTPTTRLTLRPLRPHVLAAAAELLPETGYTGLRMADVAAKVGVSRQTVYNEFGDKAALVQAVALRETAEFLDGVAERLHAASDVLTGITEAAAFTIAHGAQNPIVASILGHRAAEDLLPYLTTRGQPILRAAADLMRAHLIEHEPALDAEYAATLADGVVRLTISHLLLPDSDPRAAASRIAALIAPALHRTAPAENGAHR
ncbi:MAG: TetR family transcriptional regulator [Pseudonocardiaceae bacterium]